MECVQFSTCKIGDPAHVSQKKTNLWSDHTATIELFVDPYDHRKPTKLCDSLTPCPKHKSHIQLRLRKGEVPLAEAAHVDCRGAIYPDELCILLVSAASEMLGRVRSACDQDTCDN